MSAKGMSFPLGKITHRDLAEEIVRRATGPDGTLGYVVRLSDPPTPDQLVRLAAFRLLRQPVAIVPAPYSSVEEWAEHYREV